MPRPGSPVPSTPERREGLRACYWEGPSELKDADGKIPAPLMQAGLMLVDNSYLQRSPASSLNMSAVPYTFDLLVKPYMKLTTD